MPPRAERLEALLADHGTAAAMFIERASGVADAKWDVPRLPGKWSPAQEVKHVVLAYEVFIRDLEGGAPMRMVGTPLKRSLWRLIGLGMILGLKRIPPRARAPREVRPPESGDDHETLVADCRQRIARYEAIFRETWDRDPDKHVQHAYFGQLDLTDAMKMCTVHTRHHAAVLPPPEARQHSGG